jgi:TolB protein
MKLPLISLLSILLFGIILSGCENLTDPLETPNSGQTGVTLAKITGKIAFQRSPDRWTNHDIWIMDADGSNLLQLTNHSEHDGYPSISANGKTIAFERIRNSDPVEIFIMKSDGSGVYALTNNNVHDCDPDYHPDGKTVLFTRYNSSNQSEIWTIRDNGSGPKLLLTPGGSNVSNTPSWSPDGKQIVFQDDNTGNSEIYVCDASGKKMSQLTYNAAIDKCPSWSPCGTKIAFLSDRSGSWEIYLMNSDGSGVTQLTNNSGREFSNPAWSPDGMHIAFDCRHDNDGDGIWYFDIFIINADGTGETNITNSIYRDIAPEWGK